jgi:two-component system, NtrC family, sensor kinase
MVETGISTLDRLNAGVFAVNQAFEVVHWNRFMASNSGVAADELIGRGLFEAFPELPEAWLRWKLRSVFLLGTFAFSSWKQRPYVFKFPHNRPLTGGIDFMYQDLAFLPVPGSDRAVGSVCVLVTDATDAALSQLALHEAHRRLEHEMAERQRIETELRLAQKLESVGQLAAGIAHEINTPIQYVADSVSFLGEAFAEMRCIVQTYRQALYDGAHHVALEDNTELTYLEQHVPSAVDRALMGLERVATLVRAMKEFGQPGAEARSHADLNRAVATTLTVASAAYKDFADIELDLGDLPQVNCHVAELNQVFLALIINAAHAIEDAHASPARGTIKIRTWCDAAAVYFSVQDNGTGIREDIRDRIFDPFFTTKPIGKGTGQGLSIARAIIVDRHAGSLSFETIPGTGTTFLVRLPR